MTLTHPPDAAPLSLHSWYCLPFFLHRYLPDKALDLVDEACARVRVEVSLKPEALDRLERKIGAKVGLTTARLSGLPPWGQTCQGPGACWEAGRGRATAGWSLLLLLVIMLLLLLHRAPVSSPRVPQEVERRTLRRAAHSGGSRADAAALEGERPCART